ncbi:hypothetical protein V6N13_060498 [Hibiscus sabdariffa]
MDWTGTILAVAALILFFQVLTWKRRDGNKRLPPGPTGLPILGNLLTIGSKPHQDLQRLAHKPPHESSKYISYNQQNLAFSPYGSYWRNMRKMCTLELLSNHKIASFGSMRKQELDLLVRRIREAASAAVAVDLSSEVTSFGTDVACRMVIGKKYNRDDFGGKGFEATIREGMQIAAAFNLADYIPQIRGLDLQGLTKRMKAIAKDWDDFLEKIIDEHVRSKDENRVKDFVDVMLGFVGSEETHDCKLELYILTMDWTDAILAVAALVLFFQVLAWKKRDGNKRLPPGLRGLPILGNLLMIGSKPHHDLQRLAHKSMRKQELDLLVRHIREAAGAGGVAVDLSSMVTSFSTDVSCRMIIGKKYNRDDFSEKGFAATLREGMKIGSAFNLADYIPQIKGLDLQRLSKRMKAIAKDFDDFCEKIIEEHVQSTDENRVKDFVDVMLGFVGSEETHEYRVERDTIKAIILVLFCI